MNLITPEIGLIFWQLVVFLICLFILKKWGWPVLVKGLKDREENIKNSLKSVDDAKIEMAKLKADNELLLTQAKKERDELLKDASQIREKIIEEAKIQAKQESEKIIHTAKESIVAEREKAMMELKAEISKLSTDIAQKIIQSEMSNAENNQKIIESEMKKIQF
ncbi:MAG: F0F1 ATP synthase subunit B [Bacteroidales bacterium]|nr:F0F1 ATP synthase subunit B [Bacteroidales bacterium]MBQ9255456.1 F0F1 ATP synthase subunit B [Bacteroidales bacterium]